MMNRRDLLKTGAKGILGLAAGSTLLTSMYGKTNPFPRDPKTHIRLCCNENPHGPSPLARQAIRDSLHLGNRYPRNVHEEVRKQIAELHGLTPEHVLLGSGSAAILQLTGLWIALKKKDIVSADYTFRWLMRYAGNLGSKWIKCRLTPEMKFDLKGIRNSITGNTGLVYICNPNNPTGTALPQKEVHQFCREVSPQHTVFLDEAYIEYLQGDPAKNSASLLADFPNVMISRTFSKIYGLAGLRVGYLLADPAIIKELEALDIGFGMTISCTSLSAASASLKDKNFLQESLRKNDESRAHVIKHLSKWEIPFQESIANFVHCEVTGRCNNLKEVFESQQISMNPIEREGKTYLRITLGTLEEMQAFTTRMEPFFTL